MATARCEGAPDAINVADFTPAIIAELQTIISCVSVEELIKILKQTQAPQSAEEAIRKLLEASSQASSAQRILSSDGVPMCDAIVRFPHAIYVRRLGCAVFMKLGMHNDELKLSVASSGAIAAIKLVLLEHIDNVELLCAALGVLNSFSTVDGTKVILGREGVVKAVLKALVSHPKNNDVALRALTVLANCCLNNGANQEQLRVEGGVAVVLQLLCAPDTPEQIALKAAAALDAISAPKVKEAMLAEDAVNVLFKAMARYSENAQIQKYCLGTIRSLASVQPDAMLSAGVFQKMKEILLVNLDKIEIVEQCLAFVCGLALADAHKDTVVEAGGLSVVRAAMEAHADQVGVQHWACRCLAVLAFRKDNIKLQLVEQQFVPLLFVALQRHPRDECVQEQGLAALCTLAANKSIKQLILAAGGLDVAMRAREQNSTNEIVCKNASNLHLQLQFSDRY